MYPHRIRLRGPWEWQPLNPPAPPGRLNLPFRWNDGFRGQAQLCRNFGYPGQIDATETVWLLIDGLTIPALLRLNAQPLSDALPGAYAQPITPLLAARNRLEIRVTAEQPVEVLWEEVALEIRRGAYLDAVRAERFKEGRVRVTGVVKGVTERPLDLYVLIEGRTLAYRAVTVEPFEVRLEEALPAGVELRVELIDGSVVWDARATMVV